MIVMRYYSVMETNLVTLTCERHPAEVFTGFCPSCLRDRLRFLESTSATHRNSISDLRRCKSFSYARASNEITTVDRNDREIEKEVELSLIKDHIDFEPQSKKLNFWKKLQKWRENQKLKKTKKQQQEKDLIAEKSSRRAMETQPELAVEAFSRRSCDLGRRFSLDAGRTPFEEPRFSLDIRSLHSRFNAPVIQRSDGLISVEEDLVVPGNSQQAIDYYVDSSSRSRRPSLKFDMEMNESKAVSNAEVLPSINGGSFRDPSWNYLMNDGSESFMEKKSKNWRSIWGFIHRQQSSSSSRGGGVNGYNKGSRILRSNSNVSLRRSCDYGNGGFGRMRDKGLESEFEG